MPTPFRSDELAAAKTELRKHLDQAQALADRLGYQSCAYMVTLAIEDAKQHDGVFPVAVPDDLKN
jgi:hypothetical protein